ncbi:alpha/beta fold hydrolase [Brevibacillus sp. B_LB10_24]|uniref:alpha/beta fold hydrolase n=1 Tax=Brevibacillus sp. B_LB10_24 TaxID=3380645 RepID=UPI0038BACF99
MKLKNIVLQNVTLACHDEGDGKPIVLLHGFCGSHKYWEKVIPALVKNHRVIAPDLPGHGSSSFSGDLHSIEALAEIMKELLDTLQIKEVSMFGHSLGGYITLAFAERFTDRLSRLSLIHSTAFPDSDEAKKGREANIEKVTRQGVHSLVDGLVPKLFSQENLHKHAQDVEAAKEIGYMTAPEGAIGALKAMKDRPDRNSVLANTSLPVLLLAGDKDQIIPYQKTFSVTKENVKQSLLKNTGHMSMYEAPVQLLSEMESFLT